MDFYYNEKSDAVKIAFGTLTDIYIDRDNALFISNSNLKDNENMNLFVVISLHANELNFEYATDARFIYGADGNTYVGSDLWNGHMDSGVFIMNTKFLKDNLKLIFEGEKYGL